MKHFLYTLIALTMVTASPAQKKSSSVCSDNCKATNKKQTTFKCKLTSAELRERKATVIASLKKQVLEKKVLKNGYAYRFTGSDALVDELTLFIKTERECCDFFVFNISVSGDKSEAWLEITGPKGAKQVIETELEL